MFNIIISYLIMDKKGDNGFFDHEVCKLYPPGFPCS